VRRIVRESCWRDRAKSHAVKEVFKLKGLEPDAEYELRFEDYDVPTVVATGRSLMEKGLAIQLPNKESSQIIYLQRRK